MSRLKDSRQGTGGRKRKGCGSSEALREMSATLPKSSTSARTDASALASIENSFMAGRLSQAPGREASTLPCMRRNLRRRRECLVKLSKVRLEAANQPVSPGTRKLRHTSERDRKSGVQGK